MPSTPDTTHVRRCPRFFAGVLAIPFVAGCLSVWAFAYLLLGLLFIAVSYLILLVFGGVLFGVDGFRATADREGGVERVCVALIAPVLTVMAALSSWPAFSAGADVAMMTRVLTNRDRYAAIIADVQRRRATSDPSCCAQSFGQIIVVDGGTPLRVAFAPDGLGDNWSAAVYDPTGALADTKRARSLRKVFGGDLIGCRHLFGDYYRCTFT